MKNALIIGSNGTIGKALCNHLAGDYHVHRLSRADTDFNDTSLQQIADHLADYGRFARIICCIGVLHNDKLSPEKRLSDLQADQLLEYFRINAVLPSLCLKAFAPLMTGERQSTPVFALLSAMVGSISDNHLGGWYGYRSSKAALNMLIKTAAIELSRQHKNTAIVAIHPGTTKSSLSQPFSKRIDADKYYSPAETARRVMNVVDGLTAKDNGRFFNWDGKPIPW